jgi:ketosteroid isomerase-like protein
MTTYLERAGDLYDMMAKGQTMEAFETYYHEDVVVKEPNGETRNGKAAQRKAITDWFDAVEEMHGGETEFVTSNEEEGVTMVQSFTDVTMGGNRVPFREIAVQQWEGDQIIHEEFFYYVPAEMQKQMAAAQ